MSCGCRSLRAHPWLLVLAVGLPVVEALILGVVGTAGAQALAPQATAPAPFGVFHDLRWLLVFHSSWLAFALELSALVAVRSAITALLVRAAWPVAVPSPSPARLAGGSVLFTLVSAAVLAPFAALLLGMAVVSLSWLFFVAVPSAAAVAMLLHHGAVVPTWWRERPPDRTVGWVLLTFLVLTLASAAIVLVPGPLRPLAVAATGLFNAWAWHGIVHTLCCGERSRRLLPVVPPVGVAGLLAVVVLGGSVGYAVATREDDVTRVVQETPADLGRPVLWVAGFGSDYTGDDGPAATAQERRFSYAGSVGDGHPRPYREVDTYQDLSRSVALMAEQIDAFHATVDSPITIVAESEGALVAKMYLMSHGDAPVDALVVLSPLVEPGAAYYPPAGREGWGVASGVGLQWISAFIRAVTPLEITAGDGLFRSLIDDAPALRGLLACPVGGVEQLVVLPLADAVVGPEQLDGLDGDVIPAFHGGLAGDGAVLASIREALDGDEARQDGLWETTDTIIRAGAAAWRVPTLPLSVNPAWEEADEVADCDDIANLFAGW